MFTMNSTDHAFIGLLRPLGGVEGLLSASPSTILAYVIGLLVLILLSRRNGNKIKCLDMDGSPMKEVDMSRLRGAATFLKPYVMELMTKSWPMSRNGADNRDNPVRAETSKLGAEVAHDEPYVIQNGRHSVVVIHTAEHVREFLRNDSKDHVKPAGFNLGDYFYRVLGECVGALNGEQWRVVRSYFDPAYTHDASLAMIPLFQKEVGKWLNELKNDSLHDGAGTGSRLVVNAPTSCKVLPLRVIPKSFYGEAYDEHAHETLIRISQMQRQALGYAVTGFWQKYQWFNMFPTTSRRHLDRYHQDWLAFNLAILETARKNGVEIPAQHVFKGVSQRDNNMTINHTIDEMIFTNIDLTATILAFMLKKLASHPDFQQKLYDEIVAQTTDEALGLRGYVTRQTTLLHNLLMESIRLEPVIWYSLPECTAVDKVIGRYKIPAKTPVVFDVRRLNTDALTWGPDSREFRPERFANLSPNKYRYSFLRFGISSKCLGKHMADALLKVVVITVLQLYEVQGAEMTAGIKHGDVAFVKRGGVEDGK